MPTKSVIRALDQNFIKSFFAAARLVARYQNDRFSLRVKSKSHTPDSVVGLKPEFFHVGMSRAVQGVDVGPSQLRSKPFQHPELC